MTWTRPTPVAKDTFCHKPTFFCSLMVNNVQTWLQLEKLKSEVKKVLMLQGYCCFLFCFVVVVVFNPVCWILYERERERRDWLIELYFSTVKILAQRPTHISAVATVLLITKTERERDAIISSIQIPAAHRYICITECRCVLNKLEYEACKGKYLHIFCFQARQCLRLGQLSAGHKICTSKASTVQHLHINSFLVIFYWRWNCQNIPTIVLPWPCIFFKTNFC